MKDRQYTDLAILGEQLIGKETVPSWQGRSQYLQIYYQAGPPRGTDVVKSIDSTTLLILLIGASFPRADAKRFLCLSGNQTPSSSLESALPVSVKNPKGLRAW